MKKILTIIGLVLLFASASQAQTQALPYSIDTLDATGWHIGGTITSDTSAVRYDFNLDPAQTYVMFTDYGDVVYQSRPFQAGEFDPNVARRSDGVLPTITISTEPLPAVVDPKPKHRSIFQLHRKRN